MIATGLEDFVLERMTTSGIPGLSLILLDGDATHERHFGFRDLTTRTPPDGDTRYGIGSVTKVVTAVAIHRLAAAGAFDLDDPIGDLLPEIDGRFPAGTSPRHLLAHTAGLPALGFSESKMSDAWFMDGHPVGGWDDVATFLRGAEGWSADRPDAAWRYSNEGYLALGALIERATGERYAEHVTHAVLTPLAMTRSSFDRGEVEADPNRVAPYLRDDAGHLLAGANLYGPVPAAGGLIATPRDLAALARLFLDDGRAPDGTTLLEPGTVARMAAPAIALDDPTPLGELELWDDPLRFHGLGVQIQRVRFDRGDLDAFGHGGGVMGGTAYLLVAPAERLGVVVLANAHGYPLARLALVALATLHGATPEHFAFVRRERLIAERVGDYRSFRDTMRAELRPAPWGFELTLLFRPAVRRVPLVLLDHDARSGAVGLLALSQGRPARAEIVERAGTFELRYERYLFRHQGRLAS